ncbi:MAG: ABC transporter permease [Bacilli bacterium]|nr:ABC transporter permease [Bacilli bacterium]
MRNVKETLKYILKRVLLMVVTFLVIFVISFALIRALPLNFSGGSGTDEMKFYMQQVAIGRMYEKNGKFYENPIPVQFFNFLKNLFNPYTYTDPESGITQVASRWGYSYKVEAGLTADQVLFRHLAPTVVINIYSSLFSVPCGIGLGIFMALKKNKWQDNVLSVVIMLFISVPSFVDAFLLQYLLGYHWEILPPSVASLTENGIFSPVMFQSMILPVLAMSLGSIAGYARYTRAELTEVLTSDFMLLARTKGLRRSQATVRHALRNSMVPIFPMILGEVISVLSGSVIIEQIFTVNGVGGIYLDSINSRDLDVFQFVSMFYILIGLVGSLVVDISYGIVDPRIRMGGGKDNA